MGVGVCIVVRVVVKLSTMWGTRSISEEAVLPGRTREMHPPTILRVGPGLKDVEIQLLLPRLLRNPLAHLRNRERPRPPPRPAACAAARPVPGRPVPQRGLDRREEAVAVVRYALHLRESSVTQREVARTSRRTISPPETRKKKAQRSERLAVRQNKPSECVGAATWGWSGRVRAEKTGRGRRGKEIIGERPTNGLLFGAEIILFDVLVQRLRQAEAVCASCCEARPWFSTAGALTCSAVTRHFGTLVFVSELPCFGRKRPRGLPVNDAFTQVMLPPMTFLLPRQCLHLHPHQGFPPGRHCCCLP